MPEPLDPIDCPFCGTKGLLLQRICGEWSVHCWEPLCDVRPVTNTYVEPADAVRAWGRRAVPK